MHIPLAMLDCYTGLLLYIENMTEFQLQKGLSGAIDGTGNSSELAVQPLTESGPGLLRTRENKILKFLMMEYASRLLFKKWYFLSQAVLNIGHPLKCRTPALVEAHPSIPGLGLTATLNSRLRYPSCKYG